MGHSSVGLGPRCWRYRTLPQKVQTKQKQTLTLLRAFFFSRTSSSKELCSPAPPSSPGGEATLGLESFAEVVHKGHRKLTHPPSAVEVSLSIYSQNMNHIIILISAFHRLPKSCQLFPGSPWEGKMERGRKSVLLSQLG